MRYILLLATLLLAVAARPDVKHCLADGNVLLDRTTVHCGDFYNAEVDSDTGLTYCCEDEDSFPKFRQFQNDLGTGMYTCICQ
ncbi:hypothetical protein PoB_006706700 [Plakobranchus ocellatus]|uniref:Plethodontid modulating factor n=1 Tax=Plakobranchus ocellatus TaxID=259542 RepID=A0AAV4D8J8_9GAST|nr:hypothetical protein PoB_006706700 [Plakobranchus ocellatus]